MYIRKQEKIAMWMGEVERKSRNGACQSFPPTAHFCNLLGKRLLSGKEFLCCVAC